MSGNFSSWDDDCVVGGQFDDGNAYSDVEDSTTLVSQPRQVCLITTPVCPSKLEVTRWVGWVYSPLLLSDF